MNGTIFDRFEIKGRAALEYGSAGVVVIFRHGADAEPPAAGDAVLLVQSDGWSFVGRAADVRVQPSASATGFFLSGLAAEDVPVGAQVRWGPEIAPMFDAVASVAETAAAAAAAAS